MMRRLLTLLCVLGLAAAGQAQTTALSADKVTAGAATFGTGPLRVVGLSSGTGSVLTVDGSGDVSAGGTIAGTVAASGAWTFAIDTTFTGDLYVNGGDVRSTGELYLRGDQTLIIPTTNVYLAPGGGAGGTVFPTPKYAVNLGSLSHKYLTLHAAELWVETHVAQNTIATIGGRILVLPTTMLADDLLSTATTMTVKHNNLAAGDRVYLEAEAKVEFMAIASAASGSAGAYVYSITRNLDGSGANDWYAGDAVANTGAAGSGWIDLYSVRGVKAATEYGPSICGNERLSATYNDWETRWCIGQLNGVYGYTSSTYGAAFGDPSANNLVLDSANGIRFRTGTTVLGSWVGSTVTLGQPLTTNNTGQIQITSDAINVRWRNNSGVTSTILEIYNSGGVGIANLAADLTMGASKTIYGSTVSAPAGNLAVRATDTGGSVVITVGAGGAVRPNIDTSYALGTNEYRWDNIHLDLPAASAPNYVVTGASASSSHLGYVVGITGTKTMNGTCTVTFVTGIATATTCP